MSQLISAFPAPLPRVQLDARSHGEHAIQIYADEEVLLNELSGFIETSLRSGRAFVVVATNDHCQTIRRLLSSKPSDLNRDACLFVDADAILARFMVEGQPNGVLFRELLGEVLSSARRLSPRQLVTVFGETVAVLWLKGKKQAALRLEELWNELTEAEAFSLLCAYPARLFQDPERSDDFALACASHSTVLPDESYTLLRSNAERLRAIAGLQHKVRMLDADLGLHKCMERDLESLVRARNLEMEQARFHLHELSSKLTSVRDEERRSIGRQLHNSIAQLLAVLAMNLDLLESKPELSTGSVQLLARSHLLIQRVMQEVRSLSYGLYPPTLKILGLPAALEWYVGGFIERTGIHVRLQVNPAVGRLPHEIESGIFEIVQDWLEQVIEQSDQGQPRIQLERSGSGTLLELKLYQRSCQQQNSPRQDPALPMTGEMLEKVRGLSGRLQLVSAPDCKGFSFLFPEYTTAA
jgi:signal transduction histidine kinase